MSKAARVNVLPDVTDCELAKAPTASSRELVVSVSAQCVAVPVAVTLPSVIAATVTLRPFGDAAAGAPTDGEVLLASVYVLVAAV